MFKRLCNKILSHKFLVTIFTSNIFETNHHSEYLLIAGGVSFAGTTPCEQKSLPKIRYVNYILCKLSCGLEQLPCH